MIDATRGAAHQEPQAAEELRRKAALCRRAAQIATEGGTRADRILLQLAERLDRQATELEEAVGPGAPAPL